MTNRDKLITRAHERLERDWRIVNKYELYAEEMADFAIEVSKEAVDEFLAAVDERFKVLMFQRNSPLAECYVDAKREVYAERYGGQENENSISSSKD